MAGETFSSSFPSFIVSKQSIDFGALSGGTATVQVTVVGARPGDAILVCKPTATVPGDDTWLGGFCDTNDLVDIIATENAETATTDIAAFIATIVVFK